MLTKYKKLIIALVVIIALSIGVFFLLKQFDLLNIERLREYISSFGILAWLVFLVIQVFTTVVLCFVPATTTTFTTLGIVLFGSNVKTYLIVFSGIFISSIIMDLIGRIGGSRVIIKLIGKEEYENALGLLKEKGMVYVPFMYLLPLFPDDALCMCVGATKINFWVHSLEILLCRGIGCATMVFGINLIPNEIATFSSTNLWDYIVVITILAFWVIILFKIARFIDKKLTKYFNKRKETK